ncbi:carbon-nitrogen hydrolase family protein [Kiloniella laminariae]|uniref:carbon-nitrogen hydrolase family protein n=1 Tax=Kiloniella laminariae TaxID=454162 RepID=UPI00036A0818|nr:carbon-nitrogen hydrolase family protein [Kiloniella laminariae]
MTAVTAPDKDLLTLGLAQITPVWLNRDATLAKIADYVSQAADQDCDLVGFGEALAPGYPFWLDRTDGARFNSDIQKEIHARYLDEGVSIERGDLEPLCKLAKERQIAIYLGVMERPQDRGGHSLYCTLVYIDKQGQIGSVHRKLMPTYEERLCWAAGDGHGLRTHALGEFTVGGLNCWENWMPLARASLYAQGEDLHFSCWPGGSHNTVDLPGFIAKESRSYVMSVCGLMRLQDIPADVPHRDLIMGQDTRGFLANGGTCLMGPDGQWVIEPIIGEERLAVATIDHKLVRRERQNFDPAGHYSRPDVTRLTVDRTRQSTLVIKDQA